MFVWLNRINFRLKYFFVQYNFILFLVVFSLEGNIQYMSYLMTFEILNLWHMNFGFKMYSAGMMLFFCLLILTASTIYFFIKYLYKKKARVFFESLRYRLASVMYISINNGIRSIFLGLLHMILPESKDTIYIKFLTLIGFECLFLCMNIYLINRKNFFSKKGRQWIMIWASLLRISLVIMFSVR
jgi:hypothetical protein